MDAILIIRVQPVISNTDKEDKLLYVDGILRKLLYVLRFENSQWNSQIEYSRLQSVLNLRHSQFPAALILSSTSLWPQQAELFCKICKRLQFFHFLDLHVVSPNGRSWTIERHANIHQSFYSNSEHCQNPQKKF